MGAGRTVLGHHCLFTVNMSFPGHVSSKSRGQALNELPEGGGSWAEMVAETQAPAEPVFKPRLWKVFGFMYVCLDLVPSIGRGIRKQDAN